MQILRKLLIPGAFFAALLFSIHPVNVESVAWIAQRKGILALLFFLLSILWYLKNEEVNASVESNRTRGFNSLGHWYWLSLFAFVFAMLSKGSVATVPLILLLIVWWRRRITSSDFARIAPFFIVAIALTGVHIFFQGRSLDDAIRAPVFSERIAGAGAVVWFYLWKVVFPINLIFVYPKWQIQTNNWLWWLPITGAVVFTLFLVWQRRSWWGRSLLFAWLFFCLALVPVMGLADVGFMRHSLVADHYQYIAILGIVALVAVCWMTCHSRLKGMQQLSTVTIAVFLVSALIILTRHQSQLYSSPTLLYEKTLDKNPGSWMIHNDLGIELGKAGQLDEAIQQFRQALQLQPEYTDALNNLGRALLTKGHPQEAIEHLQQALLLKPDFLETELNLGNAFIQVDRPQDAIQHFEIALRLIPDDANTHDHLGIAYLLAGRLSDAARQFQRTLQINPNNFDACNNLAWILATSPREEMLNPAQAVELAKKALELNPAFTAAYNTLGVAYYRSGNWQSAIEWLDRSQEAVHGTNAVDWLFLAMAHERLGESNEARKYYARAVKLIDGNATKSEEIVRFRRETEKLLSDKTSADGKPENP
jgi:protein O-mannosyl-transferase